MIKRLAALAAVGLLAAILAVGAGAARDPFTGAWIGVEDRGEGSTDYMTITGPGNDGARQWLYYETNASGFCSPGGGGPLSARGTAVSEGEVLHVTITSATCANGLPGAFPLPLPTDLTATSDGRLDWFGVIFSKRGSG